MGPHKISRRSNPSKVRYRYGRVGGRGWQGNSGKKTTEGGRQQPEDGRGRRAASLELWVLRVEVWGLMRSGWRTDARGPRTVAGRPNDKIGGQCPPYRTAPSVTRKLMGTATNGGSRCAPFSLLRVPRPHLDLGKRAIEHIVRVTNVRMAPMADPMPFSVSRWADFSLELLSAQVI